jgi:zinc protease
MNRAKNGNARAGWLLLGGVLIVACMATLGAAAHAAARLHASTSPPAAPAAPATAPGAAAPATAAVAEVSTDPAAALPLDPEVVTGKLANGLTYFVRQNARPEHRAQLWLVVNAGSVLEDEDQRGLAHFVEHMCFDGTHAFPKNEITHYLESIGMTFGADINASTGFDQTIYTIQVPTDQPEFVAKGLQILEEWAHAVTFDPAEMERERGVVIEEWRSRRGAEARMRDLQLPIILAGSRYADRLPIGTLPSLQQAKREALMRFYHDWYRPDLMAVVAVGDFSAIGRERVEMQVRQGFAGLANPAPERRRESFAVPDHAGTRFAIATDAEATRSEVTIEVARPARPEQTVGDFRRKLIERLYDGMLDARFAEVARHSDPPFVGAVSVTGGGLVRPIELNRQSARVADGGLLGGTEALLVEIERVRRQHGFLAGELARRKKAVLGAAEKGYFEHDKVDSRRRALAIVDHFLKGDAIPGEAVEMALTRRLLPGIVLSEVNALAAGWSSEANRVVEMDAPARAEQPVPSEAQLRELFKTVQASAVMPWVDHTHEGPLVPQPPRQASIASTTSIPELGLTEWALSNGVRVVLKPTEFKNDEVLLSGFSPGGLSLVPDSEYTSADLAASVVAAGGAGEFDAMSLQKALTGTQASAQAEIDEFEETLRGSGSKGHADSLFQLAYLSLTAPRHDTDAYRSLVARFRSSLADRSSRPEVVFSDKMLATLYPNDRRALPMSVERLAELDYDTAFRIYRERFADASGFTFFVVGNFTLDSIRPLVLTYLGGLPSLDRHETWKPVGSKPPAGVVKVAVAKGKEPKSQVEIVFHGDLQYTREKVHELSALRDLLEIRLREVLRGDMGSVYGVRVGLEAAARPYGHYRITISFGCAPERADALTDAVFRELASLRRQGIAQTYVDQVRTTERRERETNLQENNFWLTVLANYYRYGWDPRGILHLDDLLAMESPALFQQWANAYLPDDRYVLGTLNPETTSAAAAPSAGDRKENAQ